MPRRQRRHPLDDIDPDPEGAAEASWREYGLHCSAAQYRIGSKMCELPEFVDGLEPWIRINAASFVAYPVMNQNRAQILLLAAKGRGREAVELAESLGELGEVFTEHVIWACAEQTPVVRKWIARIVNWKAHQMWSRS